MGFTGKYDFKGIKKVNGSVIRGVLLSYPVTSWLAKIPALSNIVSEAIGNWLANRGLIFLNIGAYAIGGKLDQEALDKAIDNGLTQIENPNLKLTPEQMKDIDDAVIKAADKALPYGKSPKP